MEAEENVDHMNGLFGGNSLGYRITIENILRGEAECKIFLTIGAISPGVNNRKTIYPIDSIGTA